jgi:hypothetical protein
METRLPVLAVLAHALASSWLVSWSTLAHDTLPILSRQAEDCIGRFEKRTRTSHNCQQPEGSSKGCDLHSSIVVVERRGMLIPLESYRIRFY